MEKVPLPTLQEKAKEFGDTFDERKQARQKTCHGKCKTWVVVKTSPTASLVITPDH